jgi:hypothetical protein
VSITAMSAIAPVTGQYWRRSCLAWVSMASQSGGVGPGRVGDRLPAAVQAGEDLQPVGCDDIGIVDPGVAGAVVIQRRPWWVPAVAVAVALVAEVVGVGGEPVAGRGGEVANHASRAFARLAASIGLAAHPHMLRHALASAMAANKEPASISPPSYAMPMAARSPSASTSTSSPRPHPGWPG